GDPRIFGEMTPEELDAVERSRLSTALLLGLFEARLAGGGLAAADTILDELAGRDVPEKEDLPYLREALVYEALRRGDLGFARSHLPRRRGPEPLETALNRITIDLAEKAPKPRRLDALV